MAMEARLSLRQSQRVVMTPLLQQAIQLLQLSTLELQEVVQKELLENPLLEELQEKIGARLSKLIGSEGMTGIAALLGAAELLSNARRSWGWHLHRAVPTSRRSRRRCEGNVGRRLARPNSETGCRILAARGGPPRGNNRHSGRSGSIRRGQYSHTLHGKGTHGSHAA